MTPPALHHAGRQLEHVSGSAVRLPVADTQSYATLDRCLHSQNPSDGGNAAGIRIAPEPKLSG
jgi:hypothetical protein